MSTLRKQVDIFRQVQILSKLLVRFQSEEATIVNLYQEIGQLKVQVDWLGKIKSTP